MIHQQFALPEVPESGGLIRRPLAFRRPVSAWAGTKPAARLLEGKSGHLSMCRQYLRLVILS
jgi:hypothetical protein